MQPSFQMLPCLVHSPQVVTFLPLSHPLKFLDSSLWVTAGCVWSKAIGIWFTHALRLHQYRCNQQRPCQGSPAGVRTGPLSGALSSALLHPVSPTKTVCSVSKCWLCWSWRPQRDKCYGEWLIEIQSTLQNDLFDIPSRKLLFVELIIHSCIHEKKYNKCIISA